MPLFSNIAALLRTPVGNNMENRPDDVLNVKHNFAKEGRYKRPVENGYIDEDLDKSIWDFQRENNLKQDGFMNPGGETEAALISRLLRLPKAEPAEKEKPAELHEASGVMARTIPLFAVLAAGLGMNKTEEAEEWWKDQSSDERENITRSLDHTLNGRSADKDPMQHCDDIFDDNLERCKEVERIYGRDTAAICRETAKTQYAQCLAGKPKEQWRNLHTRD